MRQVDYSAPEPPYRQVAADLLDRIRSGEIPPGGQFPSMARICQEYGIARATAQKVRGLVLKSGYVTYSDGWGTFVRKQEEWPGA